MMPVSRSALAPYWSAPGATLYHGDVRACLWALPTRSVQCVVTSPPYWGLRDYGTGDAQLGLEEVPDCLGWATGKVCGACYVCHMVEVFSEVRRVLRDDGTVWLNLGDTYSTPKAGNTQGDSGGLGSNRRDLEELRRQSNFTKGNTGLCSGNLVGIPWRVALALQADGWVLRSDIIWYSPNKMPENVENRCTKSHEHIFLLTKGMEYYYDAVAIEEPTKDDKDQGKVSGSWEERKKQGHPLRYGKTPTKLSTNGMSMPHFSTGSGTVNKRDVWVVPTQGYLGAHFATFSPRLIEPCILAGTSEHGACAGCGRPYERVVVKNRGEKWQDGAGGDRFGSRMASAVEAGAQQNPTWRQVVDSQTVGWQRRCGCPTTEVVPCVVLDPFVGSGTTVATALLLGRHGIGIDLSEEYLREHAIPRIEAALRGERKPRRPTVAMVATKPPSSRPLR